MKRFLATLALPLALFCSLAYAGEKPWQTGTVKFVGFQGGQTFNHSFATPGKVDSTSTLTGNTLTSSTTVQPPQTFTYSTEVNWFAYTIQTADRLYVCHERRSGRQRPALLMVGGDVRFYMDGDKLVLIDEANKTHKLFMVRLIQRRAEIEP